MSEEAIVHVLVHSSRETKTTVEYYMVSGIRVLSARLELVVLNVPGKHFNTEVPCLGHF